MTDDKFEETTRHMIDNEKTVEALKDAGEKTPFGHTCEEGKGKIKGHKIDRENGEVQCNWCGKSWDLDQDLWEIAKEEADSYEL